MQKIEILNVENAIEEGIALAGEQKFEDALIRFNDAMAECQQNGLPEAKEICVNILFNQSITLGILGRYKDSVETYSNIFKMLDSAKEISNRVILAKSLYNQGVDLSLQGHTDAALSNYQHIVACFGGDREIAFIVAKALFNAGVIEDDKGNYEAAIGYYDKLLIHFSAEKGIALKRLCFEARINKGIALSQLNNLNEALSIYNEILAHVNANSLLKSSSLFGKALFNRGVVLTLQNKPQQAISDFDQIIEYIKDEKEPDQQVLIARTLLRKGHVLSAIDQFDTAKNIFASILRRFKGSKITELREIVSEAMFNIGIICDMNGNTDAAINIYSNMIKRFSDCTSSAIKGIVAGAYFKKASAYEALGQLDKAAKFYTALTDRFSGTSNSIIKNLVDKAETKKKPLNNDNGLNSKVQTYSETCPIPIEEVYHGTKTENSATSNNLQDQEEVIDLIDISECDVNKTNEIPFSDQKAETALEPNDVLDVTYLNQIIEEIKNEYMKDNTPQNSIELANALIDKGVDFGESFKPEAAVVFFDTVISLFSSLKDNSVMQIVIKANYNKGVSLSSQEKYFEALDAYDHALILFDSAKMPDLEELIADLMMNKGFLLNELENQDEAIAIFDELVERFVNPLGFDEISSQIQESIANSLLKKCEILTNLQRNHSALETVESLGNLLKAYTHINQPRIIAKLLFYKGVIFEKLGQSTEAMSAFEEIVTDFKETEEMEILNIVQEAHQKLTADPNDKLLKLCNEIDPFFISQACSSLQSDPQTASKKNDSGSELSMDQNLIDLDESLLFNETDDHSSANTNISSDSVTVEAIDTDGTGAPDIPPNLNGIQIIDISEQSDTDWINENTSVVDYNLIENNPNQSQFEMLPEIAEIIAKGNELKYQQKYSEAIVLFDQIGSFIETPDLLNNEIGKYVAEALLLKGLTLEQQGHLDDAIIEYDQVIKHFAVEDASKCSRYVLNAYFHRSVTSDKIGKEDDDLIRIFGEIDNPEVMIMVAKSIYHKALAYHKRSETSLAIERFDNLIDRYQHFKSPEMVKMTAKAMLKRGNSYYAQQELDTALKIFCEVEERYGDSESPEILEIVATAKMNKGIILNGQGNSDKALSIFDEITKLYQDTVYTGLQDVVQSAYYFKGLASGWRLN